MARRTQAAQADNGRIASIDVVRALAALAVLLYHVWQYTLPNPNRPIRSGVSDHILFELRSGLIVFLVMTGYLLYRPFIRARREGGSVAVGRYLARRVGRILPAYYAALIGAALMLYPLSGEAGVRLPDRADLWLFALLAQNYSPDTLLKLDPPMWTLVVQVAFYILLPLIAVVVTRVRLPRLAVPLALIGGGLAFNAVSFQNQWGPVAALSLAALIPYFACGMLAAEWMESRGQKAGSPRWFVPLGILLVLADLAWHAAAGSLPEMLTGATMGTLRDLPAAAGFGLLICAAATARPTRRAQRILLPLAAIGRWSYGLFLWHVPFLLVMRSQGLLPGPLALDFMIVLGPAVAAGFVSWRLLERPLMQRSKRPSPIA